MSGTAYPLGDLMPNGQPKTDDSANFGLFKNNCMPLSPLLPFLDRYPSLA